MVVVVAKAGNGNSNTAILCSVVCSCHNKPEMLIPIFCAHALHLQYDKARVCVPVAFAGAVLVWAGAFDMPTISVGK